MGESNARKRAQSSGNIGTFVPSTETLSKFGAAAYALWPVKPGLNIAQRAGCTERHANLIIAGKRKPNARVALVIYAEILD